jgi:two-component system nitrogen regulation response regulator GlnG
MEHQAQNSSARDWTQLLDEWADQELNLGHKGILEQATPEFERTMIHVALKHTLGRRRDAALLLGWGRNTLTRKIKELGIDDGQPDVDDNDD